MRFRFCGDQDCPDWVLAEVATLSKLSSVRIKILVIQILSYCIAGNFNYEKVLKLAADNSDGISDIKGAVAAVHFMVSNAARHNLDEQSFVQEIQQLGLPKENSESLAKQYKEHKDLLQKSFAESSYRLPSLVAVDWRVDHTVATSGDESKVSSSATPNSNISVHLNFTVDQRPQDQRYSEQSSRTVKFPVELSAEQLDVLIHELSRATALMETVAN